MSKTPAGIGRFAENGFLGEDVSFLKILLKRVKRHHQIYGTITLGLQLFGSPEQLNPTCFLLLEGSTGLVVVVGDASLR